MTIVKAYSSRGNRYRLELQKDISGYYDIVLFEHGRSCSCRCNVASNYDDAMFKVNEQIKAMAYIDNINLK